MERHSVQLVILAGGLGSRFGGDKQLALVGETGRTLLHFSVMDAYQVGVRDLLLIVRPGLESLVLEQICHHFPDDLRVQMATQRLEDIPGTVPAERSKPWGTAHALWAGRAALAERFIVINADDYYNRDAMRQLVQHLQQSANFAMVAFPLGMTLSAHGGVNRGVCVVEAGALTHVEEWTEIRQHAEQVIGVAPSGQQAELSSTQPVSMNIWGLTREFLPYVEQSLVAFFQQAPGPKQELYLPQVINQTLAREPLQVYVSQQAWFGVTYAEDMVALAQLFSSEVNKKHGTD